MMQCLKVVLIVVMTTIGANVFAQNNKQQSSIDAQLDQCLDSSQNSTTAGMINCTVRAKDAWDEELNKNYKLLVQTLSQSEKAKLVTAQRNWLKFRNSENAFSSTIYKNMQGTMWAIAKLQADLNVIKQRALELKEYYDDKAAK